MSEVNLPSGFAGEIECILIFNLANGKNFSLRTGQQTIKANYIRSIKLEEKLSTNTDMPVGVNNGNVLNIELVSANNALIPDNKESIYYGYMDDSAIVQVTVLDIETNKYTAFGKYYVTKWTSERDNYNPNIVQIEAVNVMSLLSQQEVPDTVINRSMYIKDWLIDAVTKVNEKLANNKKVGLSESNIEFIEFPEMQFCNLSDNNMGDAMNELSQCTLTNIYTDRANNLKTNYVCDVKPKDAKYKLEVITSAECKDAYLIGYNGVVLTYSNGDINAVELLGAIHSKEITSDGLYGDSAIQIDLGNGVYKINRIECIATDDSVLVYPSKATYSKKTFNIELMSTGSTTVRVEVYGQRLDTTELKYSIGGNNPLKVTNKVIHGDAYITKYATELNKLIAIKTDQIRISGYFKTDIELGDTVYVDLIGSMNMDGYYKVVEMSWDFSMYGYCDMTLIKTVE